MKKLDDIFLPDSDRKALTALKEEILKFVPQCEIILYGILRGDETIKETEYDILVLIDEDIKAEHKNSIRTTKIALELKHDAVFSVMLAKKSIWKKSLIKSLPGHWNINEEGIAL